MDIAFLEKISQHNEVEVRALFHQTGEHNHIHILIFSQCFPHPYAAFNYSHDSSRKIAHLHSKFHEFHENHAFYQRKQEVCELKSTCKSSLYDHNITVRAAVVE